MPKSSEKLPSTSMPVDKKRQRPKVKVVVCPSAFPNFHYIDGSDGNRSSSGAVSRNAAGKHIRSKRAGVDIDFDQSMQEIHALGSTGFDRKQARKHKEAQYRALTGRDMKRQRVPLPIVRGIKKKRDERDARRDADARDSGLVTSAKSQASKKVKAYAEDLRKAGSMNMTYGPSPDVGYMKGGVLKVKRDHR